jgi:glycosyltransferase involved in cell wall biosynthesis
LSHLDAVPCDARPRTRVFLLKYFDADGWARENALSEGRRLPYALDLLDSDRIELCWSDAAKRPPWSRRAVRRLVRPLERFGAPFVDVLISRRGLACADVVLAMFESQANSLALLRALRVSPFTRPRLVVVSCWLAELAPLFSPARRALYRFAYRGVDCVAYFSRNQATVYRDVLRLPAERLSYVPFGVDDHFFSPREDAEDVDVLAVGRDRGRDWATFFEAVRGTGLTVKIACRLDDLAGLTVPENVNVLGLVDREVYRDLTACARVVVVPTRVLAYPTGQSVVLESMAMAKCCVVTDTPAMHDYVVDGQTALLVSPQDPRALRDAIERAVSDPSLRREIGAAAREAVEQEFNVEAMWARVAELVAGLGA